MSVPSRQFRINNWKDNANNLTTLLNDFYHFVFYHPDRIDKLFAVSGEKWLCFLWRVEKKVKWFKFFNSSERHPHDHGTKVWRIWCQITHLCWRTATLVCFFLYKYCYFIFTLYHYHQFLRGLHVTRDAIFGNKGCSSHCRLRKLTTVSLIIAFLFHKHEFPK